MNKEVLNWVTDLFTVLERTRLKIHDCNDILTETTFNGRIYYLQLTDKYFDIVSYDRVELYRFERMDTDNSINRGVLTKLTEGMSE